MRSIAVLLILVVSVFSCHHEDENPCIDKSKIDPALACPDVFHQVCGCDGKTYFNTCEAQRAGVKNWQDGPCAK